MTTATVDQSSRAEFVSQQYLTFALGDQDFGIEILSVQEIRNHSSVTPIPNSPAEMRGVVNLRGTVIPIIDLRLALGMPPAEDSKLSVFIVVNVANKAVGLIVDSVSDVVDVSGNDIEQTPEMINQSCRSFVRGIAKSDERLITLLDLNQLLCPDSDVRNFN